MLNISFGSYSVVLTIEPSRGYGDGGEGSMQLTAAILTARTTLMGQLVFAGVTVGSLGGGVQIPDGHYTKYTHITRTLPLGMGTNGTLHSGPHIAQLRWDILPVCCDKECQYWQPACHAGVISAWELNISFH